MRSSSFLQLKNILCDYDDQMDDSLASESSSISDVCVSPCSGYYEEDVPFIHLPEPTSIFGLRKNNETSIIDCGKEDTVYVNYGLVNDFTNQSIIRKRRLSMSVKAKRKRASASQIKILQSIFESTAFPSTVLRENLAYELGMTPRAVQIWFQNRRQAVKKIDRH